MQRSNTVFLRVIKIKISKIRLSVALHRRGELILCVFVRACAFACMRMCVCVCVCVCFLVSGCRDICGGVRGGPAEQR